MPKDEQKNILEVSENFFVPYNDSLTVMNGTLKINRQFNPPIKAEYQLQLYDRGEWILKAKKSFLNACPDIKNPASPAYFFHKFLPNCPIPKGVSSKKFKLNFIKIISMQSIVTYNMIPATPSKIFMSTVTPEYAGRYRGQFRVESKDGNEVFKDCVQFYFDLYDV